MIPGAVDIHGDGKGWNVPCDSVMPDVKLDFYDSDAVLVYPGSAFLQVDFGNGSELFLLFLFLFLDGRRPESWASRRRRQRHE